MRKGEKQGGSIGKEIKGIEKVRKLTTRVWPPEPTWKVAPALTIQAVETGRHPEVHWLSNLVYWWSSRHWNYEWPMSQKSVQYLSVYQMLPYVNSFIVRCNNGYWVCLFSGLCSPLCSFWGILAQIHHLPTPCQLQWTFSFSCVLRSTFPSKNLPLLLKIAKQMGKIEQSVKCEHLVLNSYLNEQFNSI